MTSLDHKELSKTKKYRHIANRWMLVINTSCRVKISLRFANQRLEIVAPVVVYADFESAIDDKNRYKPIILSCLAVSRIPAIQTQLRFFHAPHMKESDFRPFMEYLIQ